MRRSSLGVSPHRTIAPSAHRPIGSSFTEGGNTNVLILADGEKPSGELLNRLAVRADLFVATDGAANALSVVGPRPDVVLGDFDSLDVGARGRLPGVEFVDASDQEACDLDKAIAYCIGRGAGRITVLGAGGGRLDHTLTAVSLLIAYLGRVDLRLVDDRGEAMACDDALVVHGEPGDTLSLVALAPAEGVSLEGVRWPLRDERLAPGSRGVSNEITEPVARLTMRSGVLIVCHLRKR